VQLAVTSPPYFGLRSYLPEGHADKALELGSERTPAEKPFERINPLIDRPGDAGPLFGALGGD
jgi:hypothetical protein